MAKSLNRASLIGNLTRDPELRYTPQGTAVCTFSVATNRSWKVENGETKDEVEFHRIVAWDKLAEICSQLLGKGKKVFVEGRIQTRKWEDKDGGQRNTTEIVISDMLLLERLSDSNSSPDINNIPENLEESKPATKPDSKEDAPVDEDIPF